MDIAKVTKSFYFVPLPLLVVIYHRLEVTAAYYNIKMLTSQLENADDKCSGGQVTKKIYLLNRKSNVLAVMRP